ncbi:hypothetical protein RBB77_10435 [Tunturibacter psychrotolerans]|uniref:Uncharacterized protein n=1 Tax=Tunturiibacter psychrotolerans TaxID=3069686 RepID=A0AAU7ZWJ2_9BACT
MVEDKTLMEEVYISDEKKKKPPGYVRLPNKAGVRVETSAKYKKFEGAAKEVDCE